MVPLWRGAELHTCISTAYFYFIGTFFTTGIALCPLSVIHDKLTVKMVFIDARMPAHMLTSPHSMPGLSWH
jgi:hypothetical protein